MYISIDLGGTSTRIAASPDLKDVLKQIKTKTQQNVALEKDFIRKAVMEMSEGEKIRGLCLGVPGFVNKKERKLEKVVNIPSFSEFSFDEILGEVVALEKIIVQNDADLAGLAEAVRGAGKNHDVVAYLTLSTGVGGVRIAGKKLDPYQKFSEPGHMIIIEDGFQDEYCEQSGCLSAYLSGKSFEKINGINPSECEDTQIWERYAEKLSLGLINIIAMWAPDVIVLGGSISNKFEAHFKEPLMEHLAKHKFFTIPPIVKSEFGDDSGIIGGFVLLEQSGF